MGIENTDGPLGTVVAPVGDPWQRPDRRSSPATLTTRFRVTCAFT